MDDKTFLGTGMKFPPQIDPGTGRFAVSSAEQSVKESVYLILTTNRGERWLEPNFGSNMAAYAFADTSTTVLHMIADEIQALLTRQEPRIADVRVEIDAKSVEGCLIISIDYRVAASNTRDNLVFPFYLNVVQEERSL